MNNSDYETSLATDVFRFIRYQLRGRRGLIAGAVVFAIPALWIGWPWLVIAGMAPLIIALAPCAVMCAVGLCTMKACSTSKADGTSSCSTSQIGENKVASGAAARLTDETAKPLAIAAPSQVNMTSVDIAREVEAETTRRSGATIHNQKETIQ